jgi:hypothetical protein
MSRLKLIDLLKNTIVEQGPLGLWNRSETGEITPQKSTGVSTVTGKVVGTKQPIDLDSVWSLFCNKIINQFEGGYWFNPADYPDDKKCTNHPEPTGVSTETMFGIDRKMGDWDSKPEGRDFWGIIDKEKTRAGSIDKFCKKWRWLYRGGDLENELKSKACAMMLTSMKRNMGELIESREDVESNLRLLFHFAYACWNGSGHFQDWAREMNEAVKNGKSGNELIKLAINQRNNWTSDMNENLKDTNKKVTDAIANDPDLGDPYIDPSSSINSSNESASVDIIEGTYTAEGKVGPYDALHSFQRRKSDGFGGGLNTKVNDGIQKYKKENNLKAVDIIDVKITINPQTLTVNWSVKIGPSTDGYTYEKIDSRGSAGGGESTVNKQLDKMHDLYPGLNPVLVKYFNETIPVYFNNKGKNLPKQSGTINIQQKFFKYGKKVAMV